MCHCLCTCLGCTIELLCFNFLMELSNYSNNRNYCTILDPSMRLPLLCMCVCVCVCVCVLCMCVCVMV